MTAKDAYHHGNLRRAVMDEALRVIRDSGVEALSLRGLAAELGVSHAAPYHHFPDRLALLGALAEEGSALMDERMATAEEAAGEDPAARLLGIGIAYVTFAVERPDYYAVMSSPELAVHAGKTRASREGRGDTWGRLMRVVADAQHAGELPAGDPAVLGVKLWALVHGLAALWSTGVLAHLPQAEGGLESLAEEVLRAPLVSFPEEDR